MDAPLLTDAEFRVFGAPLPVADGGGTVYRGLRFRLEAAILTTDSARPVMARLVRDGTLVAGSEIACDWTAFPKPPRRPLWQRLARNLLSLARVHVFTDYWHPRFSYSSWFSLPEGVYEAQFGGAPGANYCCYSLELIQHV